MTSKRFLHKRTRARFSAEKSAQMNKARWDADRARRDAEQRDKLAEALESIASGAVYEKDCIEIARKALTKLKGNRHE